MFLANYSDGLTELPLDGMIDDFRSPTAIAHFLAVHPNLRLPHRGDSTGDGRVTGLPATWLGGSASGSTAASSYFSARKSFDYLCGKARSWSSGSPSSA